MKSFREFSEELESTETGRQSRAEIARQRFAAQRDKAREKRKHHVAKLKFSSGKGSSNVHKVKMNTMDARPKPEDKES